MSNPHAVVSPQGGFKGAQGGEGRLRPAGRSTDSICSEHKPNSKAANRGKRWRCKHGREAVRRSFAFRRGPPRRAVVLGLLPALDLTAVNPLCYQRCLAAVWRLRHKRTVSGEELRWASGLQFEEQFDLLLAQLVRDKVLRPVFARPFCFRIGVTGLINPDSAYVGDDPRPLIEIARQEQGRRLRILEELKGRLRGARSPEERELRLRKELSELQQLYESTWRELSDAIGSQACETIRKETEGAREPAAQQLDLSLDEDRRFKGEAEYNR